MKEGDEWIHIVVEKRLTSYPVYDCVEYSKSESGPPGQYLKKKPFVKVRNTVRPKQKIFPCWLNYQLNPWGEPQQFGGVKLFCFLSGELQQTTDQLSCLCQSLFNKKNSAKLTHRCCQSWQCADIGEVYTSQPQLRSATNTNQSKTRSTNYQ